MKYPLKHKNLCALDRSINYLNKTTFILHVYKNITNFYMICNNSSCISVVTIAMTMGEEVCGDGNGRE